MISNATQKMQVAFFSALQRQFITPGIRFGLGNHSVFAFEACDYLDRAVWFESNFAYIYIVCVHILLDFFHICAVKIMFLDKVQYCTSQYPKLLQINLMLFYNLYNVLHPRDFLSFVALATTRSDIGSLPVCV